MLAALLALALAYFGYGRRVARWLGVDDTRPTPATVQNDGVDFVPAKPFVLFGHHYASIAAAGPIVGPTIALAYGVVPTWLWILGGVALLGAVHDVTALFLSVRSEGRSIAEVTRRALGPVGYGLFLCFAILLCILVCAAFLDLTAVALTSTYPLEALSLTQDQTLLRTIDKDGTTHAVIGGVASTSVVVMTAFAPILGWLMYRRGMRTWTSVLLSALVGAFSVWVGLHMPISVEPTNWIFVVATYCLVAGFIPVWVVIQPRDFTNVQFLYVGIATMVIAVLACGARGIGIDAPAFAPADAPGAASLGAIWPTLFVTVACGSISGAHALVAGGTTSKQVAKERHILPIGYGGMLGEALLGICVTLVILAGLGMDGYSALVWPTDAHGHVGKGNAPLAFAASIGQAMYRGLDVSPVYGTLFGILLLEGFLVTTIDTLVRLTRYLLEELWTLLRFTKASSKTPLAARVIFTMLPLALILSLTLVHGYKRIWPVFGTANQLLAALTLTAATAWLLRRGRPILFTALPAAFMIITTLASLWNLQAKHRSSQDWILLSADFVLAALALAVLGLAARQAQKLQTQVRTDAPPTV